MRGSYKSPSLMVRIKPPLPPAGSLSPAALDWTGRKQHSPNGVRLKEATRAAPWLVLRGIHDRWLSADRVVTHFPACSMTNREMHSHLAARRRRLSCSGRAKAEPSSHTAHRYSLILLGRCTWIGSDLAPSATPHRILEPTTLCPAC